MSLRSDEQHALARVVADTPEELVALLSLATHRHALAWAAEHLAPDTAAPSLRWLPLRQGQLCIAEGAHAAAQRIAALWLAAGEALGPLWQGRFLFLSGQAALLAGDPAAAAADFALAEQAMLQVEGPRSRIALRAAIGHAEALLAQGQVQAALGQAQALLARSHQLANANDLDDADAGQAVALLAAALDAAGRWPEAQEVALRAVEILSESRGRGHPDTALATDRLAHILSRRGDAEGADRLWREAHNICLAVLGADHPRTARAALHLARARHALGDLDDAIQQYRLALRALAALLGAQHPWTAHGWSLLGSALLARGLRPDAEDAFLRALACAPPEHPDAGDALCALVALRLDQKEPLLAIPLFARAHALRALARGEDHPDTTDALRFLGTAQLQQDLPEQAAQTFRRLIAALGPQPSERSASAHLMLGHALLRLPRDHFDEAIETWRQAAHLYEICLGPRNPRVQQLRAQLAQLRR